QPWALEPCDAAVATKTARNATPKMRAGRARSDHPSTARMRWESANGATNVGMAATMKTMMWIVPCQDEAATDDEHPASATRQSSRRNASLRLSSAGSDTATSTALTATRRPGTVSDGRSAHNANAAV